MLAIMLIIYLTKSRSYFRSYYVISYPYVYFGARIPLALEDLGRGVGRGPAPGRKELAGRVVVAEPEVCDLDVHVRVE